MSFWKFPLINPPEREGRMIGSSFTGMTITMPKYQNPPFGSIGK
jgi:hypothetical protein